jgi:hypothetical protein
VTDNEGARQLMELFALPNTEKAKTPHK